MHKTKMSENAPCVWSSFLLFSVVFLILNCHSILCHSLNSVVRDLERAAYFEIPRSDIKKITISKEKLPIHYTKGLKHDEKNYPSDTIFEEYTSEAEEEAEFPTSCGKINCHYVKDYPEELIRKIFLQTYHKDEEISSSNNPNVADTTFAPEKSIFFRSANHPSKIRNWNRKYPIESKKILNQLTSGRKVNKQNIHSSSLISAVTKERPSQQKPSEKFCYEMNLITHPKEAINKNNESVFLVSLPEIDLAGYTYPRGLECTAPKCCTDTKTPFGSVYFCKNRIESRDVPVLNRENNKIMIMTVNLTAGCNCTKIHYRTPPCPPQNPD